MAVLADERAGFAVLSRGEGEFLQAAIEPDGTLLVEARAGRVLAHHADPDADLQSVTIAFLAFAARDPRWKSRLPFRQVSEIRRRQPADHPPQIARPRSTPQQRARRKLRAIRDEFRQTRRAHWIPFTLLVNAGGAAYVAATEPGPARVAFTAAALTLLTTAWAVHRLNYRCPACRGHLGYRPRTICPHCRTRLREPD